MTFYRSPLFLFLRSGPTKVNPAPFSANAMWVSVCDGVEAAQRSPKNHSGLYSPAMQTRSLALFGVVALALFASVAANNSTVTFDPFKVSVTLRAINATANISTGILDGIAVRLNTLQTISTCY